MLTFYGKITVFILMLALAALVIWAFPAPGYGSPRKVDAWPIAPLVAGQFDAERYEPEEIDEGISWLIDYLEHRHRFFKDDEWRSEVVNSFYSAGDHFEIPQLLLTAMSYRETVFDQRTIGPAGERGLMQVGPYCRNSKKCAPYCGMMRTPQEQINCGACCFKSGIEKCGGLYGGLVSYLSYGGKCKTYECRKPNKVRWAANQRFRLWSKQREIVGRPTTQPAVSLLHRTGFYGPSWAALPAHQKNL